MIKSTSPATSSLHNSSLETSRIIIEEAPADDSGAPGSLSGIVGETTDTSTASTPLGTMMEQIKEQLGKMRESSGQVTSPSSLDDLPLKPPTTTRTDSSRPASIGGAVGAVEEGNTPSLPFIKYAQGDATGVREVESSTTTVPVDKLCGNPLGCPSTLDGTSVTTVDLDGLLPWPTPWGTSTIDSPSSGGSRGSSDGGSSRPALGGAAAAAADSSVDQLIQAMAGFAPPAAANSTLLTEESSSLTTAFAVNAA